MAATLTLSSKLSPFPFAAIATATYTQKAVLVFDETAKAISLNNNGSDITVEEDIVLALAEAGGLSGDSAKVSKVRSHPSYIVGDNTFYWQTSSFFAMAKALASVTTFSEIVTILDSLDDHLAFRTYLVGHDITAADWIVWGAIKGLLYHQFLHIIYQS